jgi:acetylornithine deacetylase
MLNAHMDTVGAGEMAQPFTPQVRGNRLYGRGAQDMKGSLAACITAVKALIDADIQPAGDLLIAAVADEEYASLGTSEVIETLAASGSLPARAIVTEPTEMRIALAHRGFTWLKVETRGQAAHGSRWWEGIDANRHMGRLLVELDSLADELTRRPPHPLVGPPSLHTPLLNGGSEMSIYAAHCILHIERRNVPGETPDQIEGEIRSILDRLAAADPHFQANLETWFARPAFEARRDSALLPLLSLAYTAVMGVAPATVGVPFWTDAALLAAAGVDTLLLGPTGAGLHTQEEWVDIDSCVMLAGVLAETALSTGKNR